MSDSIEKQISLRKKLEAHQAERDVLYEAELAVEDEYDKSPEGKAEKAAYEKAMKEEDAASEANRKKRAKGSDNHFTLRKGVMIEQEKKDAQLQ